jgi:hypothetical protein
MADRYIEHLVISDAENCKVVLDNGDELKGVVSIDINSVHATWFPQVKMEVNLSKRINDG